MTPSQTILIVEARFYEDLADELYAGAEAFLTASGFKVDRLSVPGAFEIPAAIAMAAKAGRAGHCEEFAGYVALGVVIRGETSHYDYVCGESARGLQDLAVQYQLAIGYGILTTENGEQAWARADRKRGNKGRAAAKACVDMISIKQRFGV
ncbi:MULTISPECIES: 6,7-dimethyl-8-ribityllumazine synthase [unclassified Iodidimonas]|jgi:6,7-dimethyl-8-ribityllumazine synthase|uniref:6,7-dimethyl-8-ribityllumazine synthase n=1 Tax=unclassified Iodidimonas TaxID=2626145 RepID=UPI0024826F64|nr:MULTISPECIES: 6,7-dimethyl-8-ribityllumazine synthase [unclassified Iodidimonas]